MSKIVVKHTSMTINDYTLGDNTQLEKYLSLWDENRYCFVPRGYLYNEEEQKLHIPRGIEIGYVEKAVDGVAEVDYTPDEYSKASIKIKASPKDNGQRRAIAFLTGQDAFKYTAKYSQLLLNLPPGEGKTVISTMAIATLGLKTIIITHIDKIKDQWIKTLLEMTDLTEYDICDINSSRKIDRLLNKDSDRSKVYIVNHATLLSYAKTNGWKSITKLFKHIKVGIKIYDEAHLNFDNILKIDMSTNTKKTFYLTATFERSDHKENKLFNRCFKNVVKFTINETQEPKRKHTIYLSILYNSKPTVMEQAVTQGRRGFDKNAYSDYQLNSDEFYRALAYAVKFFESKEGKMLVLSTKIELVENITKFLKENIENKTINSYHSKVDKDVKDNILIYSDIISSTPKSAGTGLDINKLRTVIMTEAYSSKVQAEQASGRLREYSPDDYTFYVELVDVGFKTVNDMYKKRLPVFKKKCLKVMELNMVGKL